MTDGPVRLATIESAAVRSPFAIQPVSPSRKWWERLLLIGRPNMAVVAIENLVAASAPTAQMLPAVHDILRRYGARGHHARTACVEVWTAACASLAADRGLSPAETAYLADLAAALGLEADEEVAARTAVTSKAFRGLVEREASGAELRPVDYDVLNAKAAALGVPNDIRDAIYSGAAKAKVEEVIQSVTHDQRLSPEGQARIDMVLRHLGVRTPTYTPETRVRLDRFSLYWRAEHDQLPALEVAIALQKGEICLFRCSASLLEWRKHTTTVGYSSAGVSIRIVRGVYYHTGVSRPHRVTQQGLESVDAGQLYLTNKRVIFMGQRKNSTTLLSQLLGIKVYRDGFHLEKSNGAGPTFVITGDVELAAVILGAKLASTHATATA